MRSKNRQLTFTKKPNGVLRIKNDKHKIQIYNKIQNILQKLFT